MLNNNVITFFSNDSCKGLQFETEWLQYLLLIDVTLCNSLWSEMKKKNQSISICVCIKYEAWVKIFKVKKYTYQYL